MTTNLQYSINPSTNSSAPLRIFHHHCYPKPAEVVVFHKLEHSMDRIFEFQDIESMKKTMLMQEHVFKQQVHELHRLYDLQKKLMQELEKVHVFHARDDDPKELINSIERSRNIPTINHLFDEEKKDCNLRRRIDDDEEESDVQVELTLSIGSSHCTRISRRSKSSQSDDQPNNKVIKELGSYGEPIKSAVIISSSSSNTTSSSNIVHNQESSNIIARPHWLLQDLSLNRTTR